jgi:arylsulfatase A-like enzyme
VLVVCNESVTARFCFDLNSSPHKHSRVQKLFHLSALFLALVLSPVVFAAGKAGHVVVIVWDGMRPDFISNEHTPTLYQLARDGVMFENHHAVYCSSTEVNGTAIATGAYPQHSGIIANREYRPDIDSQKVIDTQSAEAIRKGDQLSDGHYLMRPTTAEILQAAGLKTVIAGTKPVAQLHDRRERPDDNRAGMILFEGKVMPPSLQEPINELLGKFPAAEDTKSLLPNEKRDEWTTRALTGPLWSNGVPAFSLLWLSEPDFSQHPSAPGSPKSLAGLESSDRKLAEVLRELERRKLRDQTDVFVVSDHGFSTIERGVDVASALQQAGFPAQRSFTNAPQKGDILVDGLGGTTLFYIVGHESETARKLIDFLQRQDFAGVIFSREKMEGTFDLDGANIHSPQAPDVAVSLRWSADNSKLGVPGMLVIDEARRANDGSHSSLSRFDLHNTLVGAGPDLKKGFADTMPTGNTDLAPTILWLLGVKPKVPMDGRVLSEALAVKGPKAGRAGTRRIEASRKMGESIWHQYLQISRVNDTIYFDEGNGSSSVK